MSTRDGMRREYYADVRSMAESIREWWKETPGADREDLMEYIHESIDGCARVIYTASAQECVLVSANDGAYVDDFGPEGIVEAGCIQWSRLAYAAFMCDVIEQLNDEHFDVNNPLRDENA